MDATRALLGALSAMDPAMLAVVGRVHVPKRGLGVPVAPGYSGRLAPQGRNEQCNCGSGKKFKKCCLKDPQKYQEFIVSSTPAPAPQTESTAIPGAK